ncbi:LPXTG-motif cell wall-anchored protein [Balamuthia mandrillaris]
MNVFLQGCALFLFSCVLLSSGLSREYDRCVQLRTPTTGSKLDYRLHWTLEEDEVTIAFALEANVPGWIAIGISADGSMTSSGAGSDIMLGYVDDGDCSEGCVNDYWVVTKTGSPPVKLDDRVGGNQSLTFVAGSEVDGVTAIEFTRLLDTGDDVTDHVIDPSSATHIIFAAHTQLDPTSPSEFLQHIAGTNDVRTITFDSEESDCASTPIEGGDGDEDGTEDGSADGSEDGDGTEDGGDGSGSSALNSFLF